MQHKPPRRDFAGLDHRVEHKANLIKIANSVRSYQVDLRSPGHEGLALVEWNTKVDGSEVTLVPTSCWSSDRHFRENPQSSR
jgi:hypothetical protein